jgi:PmbA protein
MLKEKHFFQDISEYCLGLAKKLGATGCEVIVSNNFSESVTVRNNEVEQSERSENLSVGLTTYINKKRSNVATSRIDKKELFLLVERCVEMTKVTPEDPYVSMPPKEHLANSIKDLDLYDETNVSTEKKIFFLKEMENEAFSNKKIVNSNGCSFSESKSNFILMNSLGFAKGYKTSMFSAACAVVAKDQDTMETDYDFSSKRFAQDLNEAKNIGSIAGSKAVNKLGARKISSTKLPVIFDKRVSKAILSSFASAISGSAFSRGTSFLRQKLNKKIFNKNINIFDDPLIPRGLGSQPFDGEGCENQKIQIVKNGVLKELFLDTYSSNILKIKNNNRSGGSTNLFFKNGNISLENIIKDQKKAIYITDLIGRGSDTITGDYSVGASGVIIENGELTYPVNEITIAANLLDIYSNLILADDLELLYSTNAPTILIEQMTIAGK